MGFGGSTGLLPGSSRSPASVYMHLPGREPFIPTDRRSSYLVVVEPFVGMLLRARGDAEALMEGDAKAVSGRAEEVRSAP